MAPEDAQSMPIPGFERTAIAVVAKLDIVRARPDRVAKLDIVRARPDRG